MDLDVVFKIIDHGTAEYKSAVSLRERILRAPFGLSFSEAELLAEKSHIQIVGLKAQKLSQQLCWFQRGSIAKCNASLLKKIVSP